MLGVSDAYLIPYGIALGATPAQIAFLASAPMLVATIFQTWSPSATQSIGSRTKLVGIVVFFHALAWLPIVLIPYLPTTFVSRPWMFLLALIVFMSFGAFATPVWQSVMFDYIPVKKRGQYFGWRNRLQGIFTVASSVLAGLVLHHYGKDKIHGFTIIFCFAMICRFFSWFCLTKMTEPFRHTSHDIYFSFFDFIRQIRTSNFAKFVFFISAMSFAANISSALFSVFLIKDLGLSYASYMGLMTAAAVAAFLFQGWWGGEGDRGGNWRVLQYSAWGIAVIPLLWMISHHWFYLFFVQIFAGGCWGGFNLLISNYIAEAVSPEKRIRCISYFNVMNSGATFLGAILGGFLIGHLPPLFGYSFLTLFLISCGGRFLVMFFLARNVREVRAV